MKNLVVVFFLAGLSFGLSAQNDIQFCFQLSPTISWLTTNDNKINSNGPNLGLQLGMIGEFYFRENYSLATGIGFHFNAGGKLFYEETIDTVGIWTEANIPGDNIYEGGTDFKYSIQYVEFPIGLKLRTREFGYLRYYVIQSAVNLLNISWGIGAGMEYTVSSNTALVGGIAFQTGFTDVTKDKNTTLVSGGRQSEEDSKGKLNSIVLRLGVMF